MRFLITNDDGIEADGIIRLAKTASRLGEVWVIAPNRERSANSQCITIGRAFEVYEFDFPVPNVHAYAVDGTPADCIRMGVDCVMTERPDYILSGVNYGLNTGYDCAYSGTLGAAFEGLMQGIPSIALSTKFDGPHEVEDAYMYEILKELIEKPAPKGAVWNVNFPGCPLSEFKGKLYDRSVADAHVFDDHYKVVEHTDRGFMVRAFGTPTPTDTLPKDSDAFASRTGYISIGPAYLVSAR